MVETRNRWHTREMFKELHAKYPDGRIRLPVGSQFDDSDLIHDIGFDKIPEDFDVDTPSSEGEIVGVFSGWCEECTYYHYLF